MFDPIVVVSLFASLLLAVWHGLRQKFAKHPSFEDLAKEHVFIAPGKRASRSPCPALNALANHGYLPRDGQKITGHLLVQALRDGYNTSLPLALFLSYVGLALLGQAGPICLQDLARHNRIEHHASIAHVDTPEDEEYAPTFVDTELFELFMQDSSGFPSDPKSRYLDAGNIAKARVRRENESEKLNGKGSIDAVHQEIARGETALVLSVFGDDERRVPVDVFHHWWKDERLPPNWKPVRQTTLFGTIKLSSLIRSHMNALKKSKAA